MHDPKFEKEVQQRMEELEFSPSEGVWVNLQRELRKEKRRRVPLLWLFFLVGGMLLGAGGASLVFFHASASRTANNTTGTNTVTTGTNTVPTGTANELKNGNAAATTGSGMTNLPAVTSARTTANPPAMTNTRADEKDIKKDIIKTSQRRAMTPVLPMTASMRNGNGERQVQEGETGIGEPVLPGLVSVIATPALIGFDHHADPSSQWNRITLPATRNKPDLSAFTSSFADKPATQKTRLTRTPSWEAGFAGGVGASSIYVTHAPSSGTSGLPAFPQVSSLNGSLTSLAARQQTDASQAASGLSYWAGIFVQKPVFSKLTLAAGLNLHYYSTRLQTGQKVQDNPNTATASLFTSSAYIQSASSPYPSYAPGDNYVYTERYYFLEIPISLQWQFNHSRKIPLFWEGGMSFSRLISANALYFNEKSRVYYRDGQIANPTQYMAFSSLMVGLSWRGNFIRFGPQAQYGLNSLLDPNSAGSQHLFYGGIKITVVPRKW